MVGLVSTKTQLCNLALGHTANQAVVDVDTENSTEAEACRTYYDAALAFVLKDSDWKFCSAKKALVSVPIADPITQDDLDGWQFIYAVPEDLIMAREIVTANQAFSVDGFGFGEQTGAALGPANRSYNRSLVYPQAYTNSNEQGFGDDRAPPIPFNLALIGDTQYLFTDVENARLRYTRLISTVGAYPIDFALLFSWYLAHLTAYTLTRKIELRQTMLKMYEEKKNEISAWNLNETTQIKRDPPAPWIRARGGF